MSEQVSGRSTTHGPERAGGVPTTSSAQPYKNASAQWIADQEAKAMEHTMNVECQKEIERRAGLLRMQRHMQDGRFADLRNGGNMPKEQSGLIRLMLASIAVLAIALVVGG